MEDWRGRAYRHAADLENARRRFNRERDELKKFGAEGLLRDMLPVVDNLERALAHSDAGNSLVEALNSSCDSSFKWRVNTEQSLLMQRARCLIPSDMKQ